MFNLLYKAQELTSQYILSYLQKSLLRNRIVSLCYIEMVAGEGKPKFYLTLDSIVNNNTYVPQYLL
jgi:hypothetical protein